MAQTKKATIKLELDYEFRDGTSTSVYGEYEAKTFTHIPIQVIPYLMSELNRPGNEDLLHYTFILAIQYCSVCGELYKENIKEVVDDKILKRLEKAKQVIICENDRVEVLIGKKVLVDTVTNRLNRKYANIKITVNGKEVAIIESVKYFKEYYKDKLPKQYKGTPLHVIG